MNNFHSINDYVICKPVKDVNVLRTTVKSGFASVSQVSTITSLEVLFDAAMSSGSVIPKGCKVFVKEKDLATMPWAKEILTLDQNEIILIPKAAIIGIAGL